MKNMGRTVVSVIAGYVTMFVFVFVMFTVAYLALGADRAFKPGTYDVSGAWIVVSIIVGLVAAVLGGAVCATIAKNPKAPVFLAVVVVILGVLFALPTLMSPDSGPPEIRTGDVGNTEAMSNARSPTWMNLLNPVLGAVGVLIGGRMRRRPHEA
jgi:hypothetical protein